MTGRTYGPRREITVYRANSVEEGNCNACLTYLTPEGVRPHRVVVIMLRASSIRLCDGCVAELVPMLEDVSP